jgi:16S rRNA (cytidine1402-2'-O)-methyltransferase
MLYICATPIGNLKDITLRAVEVLASSDIILCEDTRISKTLLAQQNIKVNRLVALHEHNENEVAAKVITWLAEGLTITQISDAGTPGVSDPGSRLCNKVREHGFKISPLPGACAYISLLSVSGLNCSSLFYGFLPSNSSGRKKILTSWQTTDYAICIYEAPHRIVECVKDIILCLGDERDIVMGRELTKKFETITKNNARQLLEFIEANSNQQRGEFVLIICPSKVNTNQECLSPEQINTLKLLVPELPPKKAVLLTHKLVGGDKDLLYNYAISLK